jgi:SAM-dependent methyltransferase
MGEMTDSMRLGKFEFLAMNNPIRRLRQKYGEFPVFYKMLKARGIELASKVIVDMGCGSGYGTKLILDQLKPAKVIAFDLMPEQIALAKRRNLPADFTVGDATAMDIPDSTCAAVFDFAVLHHIPSWRTALTEAARVLVPEGILLIEEPHKLFEWEELESGIEESGFKILDRKQWYGGFFRFFLAQKGRPDNSLAAHPVPSGSSAPR